MNENVVLQLRCLKLGGCEDWNWCQNCLFHNLNNNKKYFRFIPIQVIHLITVFSIQSVQVHGQDQNAVWKRKFVCGSKWTTGTDIQN